MSRIVTGIADWWAVSCSWAAAHGRIPRVVACVAGALFLTACAWSASAIDEPANETAEQVAPAEVPRAAGPDGPAAPLTAAHRTQWSGFLVQPERPAPGFSLTDHTGEPWGLTDARGKVVALFFGYTRCPDVCPLTLGILGQALAQLGTDGDDVRVVLVTTDPEHDTPAVLSEYIAGYDQRFVALTGTREAARAAADLFGAVPSADVSAPNDADSHSDVGDPTAHSSRVWLIDAFGQMRVSFVGAFTPDDVAHDLAVLLDERR